MPVPYSMGHRKTASTVPHKNLKKVDFHNLLYNTNIEHMFKTVTTVTLYQIRLAKKPIIFYYYVKRVRHSTRNI